MSGEKKPIIGIIGGIGAGKSAAAAAFADLGCVVADSDALAREALADESIRAALIGFWGSEILDPDGRINRRAVAKIVFGDPQERRRLESVTHPWIDSRRQSLFGAAPSTAPALVLDAPLLLEAGLDRECDAVIFVETARSRRAQWVAELRGWDDLELSRREDSQLPLDEKRLSADYVLYNTGDLMLLQEQVRRTLNKIIDLHRGDAHPAVDER